MRIIALDQVDSTNDEVRRRARAGEGAPFWVRARAQSSGRGRRGRAWSSLDGNLFISGLYRLACPPVEAAQLSFAAALAVAEALDAHVASERVRVKWPNDVLLDCRKVAGVLLESQSLARGLELVIGCGVNLASAPPAAETDRPATSLAAALDPSDAAPPDPGVVGERLVARFEHWRRIWGDAGFEELRRAWLARAAGLGAALTARLPEVTLQGVFEDLDADGALMLRVGDELKRVRAGEVFLPDTGEAS